MYVDMDGWEGGWIDEVVNGWWVDESMDFF